MIDKLYKNNFEFLYNYAIRHTGDEQFALDAVQETFLRALIKENKINSSNSSTGWLFKTLRNIIGNEYQKRKKHRFVELSEGLVSTYNEPCKVYELLPHSLPSSDKTLIIMRFDDCYSYHDISTTLGIKEVTCRKRFSRAIKYCRKEFEYEKTDY